MFGGLDCHAGYGDPRADRYRERQGILCAGDDVKELKCRCSSIAEPSSGIDVS